MKNGKSKFLVILGGMCLLLVAAASFHSVKFNDSRLVVPMDLSEYAFCVRDLPMIISVSLFILYILYLFVLLIRKASEDKRRVRDTQTTRRISPQMGFLGFFGFLGFLGFWTYSVDKSIYPFMAFTFFGFFGFFYEGKMSDTFMDERYKENRMKANFTAYRIGLSVIFLAAVILGQGRFMGNLEYTFIAFLIIVAISFALVLFLSEYLLYHYDHDEYAGQPDGSEE